MKTRVAIAFFAITSVSLVVISNNDLRNAWGQTDAVDEPSLFDDVPSDYTHPQLQPTPSDSSFEPVRFRTDATQYSDAISDQWPGYRERKPRGKVDVDIRKAKKKLQAAKSEEEKAAVLEDMSTLLDSYFVADMKRREKVIVDIETRVEKLRAQLEKRRAAQDKIIRLQLQVLSNEAEGLGFFSPSNTTESLPWFQTPQSAGSFRSRTTIGPGPRPNTRLIPPAALRQESDPRQPSLLPNETEQPVPVPQVLQTPTQPVQ